MNNGLIMDLKCFPICAYKTYVKNLKEKTVFNKHPFIYHSTFSMNNDGATVGRKGLVTFPDDRPDNLSSINPPNIQYIATVKAVTAMIQTLR